MTSFVNRNLPAIELSLTRQAWEAHRKEAANGDLTPGSRTRTSRAPRWISKRIIDREAYTIEKILFESYPGMYVPGLVGTSGNLGA
jgi:hypothetical protein